MWFDMVFQVELSSLHETLSNCVRPDARVPPAFSQSCSNYRTGKHITYAFLYPPRKCDPTTGLKKKSTQPLKTPPHNALLKFSYPLRDVIVSKIPINVMFGGDGTQASTGDTLIIKGRW